MKTIKSILFIVSIVIVFLSFSNSNASESEDGKPLDFFKSISLIDGDFLDRSIISELSESLSILPNVSISDSVDSGFLIREINAEGNGLSCVRASYNF